MSDSIVFQGDRLEIVVNTTTDIADHGDKTIVGSIAWICEYASSLSSVTVRLLGHHTYHFPHGDGDLKEGIPANVCLIIEKDAIIEVAEGYTLTIKGPIEAGDYQIFDGDGVVSLKFQARVKAAWFGFWPGKHHEYAIWNRMQSALLPGAVIEFLDGYYDLDPPRASSAYRITTPQHWVGCGYSRLVAGFVGRLLEIAANGSFTDIIFSGQNYNNAADQAQDVVWVNANHLEFNRCSFRDCSASPECAACRISGQMNQFNSCVFDAGGKLHAEDAGNGILLDKDANCNTFINFAVLHCGKRLGTAGIKSIGGRLNTFIGGAVEDCGNVASPDSGGIIFEKATDLAIKTTNFEGNENFEILFQGVTDSKKDQNPATDIMNITIEDSFFSSFDPNRSNPPRTYGIKFDGGEPNHLLIRNCTFTSNAFSVVVSEPGFFFTVVGCRLLDTNSSWFKSIYVLKKSVERSWQIDQEGADDIYYTNNALDKTNNYPENLMQFLPPSKWITTIIGSSSNCFCLSTAQKYNGLPTLQIHKEQKADVVEGEITFPLPSQMVGRWITYSYWVYRPSGEAAVAATLAVLDAEDSKPLYEGRVQARGTRDKWINNGFSFFIDSNLKNPTLKLTLDSKDAGARSDVYIGGMRLYVGIDEKFCRVQSPSFHYLDSSAPTTGLWEANSIVWNSTPSAGSYIGWVYIVHPGSPGIWKGFGLIET